MRSRSAEASARKVELGDLTPPPDEFLGRAAYLELALFEDLSRVVSIAPTTDAKERLSRSASLALAKHHALTALLERRGVDPAEAMSPFAPAIDDFQRRTLGSNWPESLMTCYVTAGFLDDFLARLAAGLPGDLADRARQALESDTGQERLAEMLAAQIAANPRTASRLALWGRRLVGDTMLVARQALAASVDRSRTEERIEPVMTDLISAHSRRMDKLGLTA